MYWKDIWEFPSSNEIEYKFAGKYGAKGEKRLKRIKPTPDQIKKQNQANKEKRMRRLIKANFRANDIWLTLKYEKGTRKPVKEVQKDLQRFLRSLRNGYKKRGAELKYIYRMEIGKQGGIHIHSIINRIQDVDLLIQDKWKHGRASYEAMYESGGFERLANYIVKPPPDEMKGQLSLFDLSDRRELLKYSSSRNLIRPKPKRKVYMRSTVRRIIENGATPSRGFYIDKDSIVAGINKYNGYAYIHYTEYRLGKGADDG
ncbi:MAG: hypothetical protein E7300_00865 [Lachnospiraceae bacterium]|nr:hypothetical protein [Lachnospiraceae bacterium]